MECGLLQIYIYQYLYKFYNNGMRIVSNIHQNIYINSSTIIRIITIVNHPKNAYVKKHRLSVYDKQICKCKLKNLHSVRI